MTRKILDLRSQLQGKTKPTVGEVQAFSLRKRLQAGVSARTPTSFGLGGR